MKKVVVSLLVLTIILLLCSCAYGVDKEAQEEIKNYYNNVFLRLAELEDTAQKSYDDVIQAEDTTDADVYEVLTTTTLEAYDEVIHEAQLELVSIKNQDLRDAHSLYLKHLRTVRKYMETMVFAIEDDDTDRILEANDIIEEANDYLIEYGQKFSDLLEKYKVDLSD